MRIESVHFQCVCQELLVAQLNGGSHADGNTCPKCRKHIRVQVSRTTKRGVAVFVGINKGTPYHKVWYNTYREWHRDQMRSYT